MSWQFDHLAGPGAPKAFIADAIDTPTGSETASLSSFSHLDNDPAAAGARLQVSEGAERSVIMDQSCQRAKVINDVEPTKRVEERRFLNELSQQQAASQRKETNTLQNQHQMIDAMDLAERTTAPEPDQVQLASASSGVDLLVGHSAFGAMSSAGRTLMDNLASDQHAIPWATYSMPMYSSFGVDLNFPTESESALVGQQTSLSDQKGPSCNNNIETLNNLEGSANLIERFNPQNKVGKKGAGFSSLSSLRNQSTGKRPNHPQDNLIGSGRSYSSVIRSSQDMQAIQDGRLSMFSYHQQSTDNNASPSILADNKSSLAPTNQRHSSNLQHDYHPHHQQQQQQQQRQQQQESQSQARHTGEFIPIASQHSHQSTLSANPARFNFSAINQPQPHRSDSVSTANYVGYLSPGSLNFNEKNHLGGSGGIASTSNGLNKRRNKLPFFTNNSSLGDGQHTLKVDMYGSALVNSDGTERFSRKVFVGGLPPDIDEEEIKASFRRFGSLVVDWPHKAESKSYFPPKGYAFLLFHEESSVQSLIDACIQGDDKLYLCVSSPTIKDKPVQIRPWRLSDADFVLDSTLALDPRRTVFVGGVPRPLKASELANIMNNLYGGVCYAGIDTDPELKYPKGAGRVAFSNHQSYIAAISARFVHLHHSEIEKRVEVKPYVLDDQFCDECQGARCGNKFAPFFCANVTCLQYYCENCWSIVHSQPGHEFHKPLVKEGADRPRGLPLRWC